MRTIKFRGKRINRNGEWAYGDLRILPDRTLILSQGTYDAAIDRDAVDENTTGQFTGLLDKNGKEIFEGDVIQDDYYNKHLIQYDEQEACFVACLLPITKFSSRGNVSQNWINEFDKVVIGNIHDNPELLKNND